MVFLKYIKLRHWPIIGCMWFIFTVVLCYIIAVAKKHVPPILPFISDCGALPPESCIFSVGFNLGAAFVAVLAYIQYKRVIIVTEYTKIDLSDKWNTAALWSAYIFALGISVTGNFQETAVFSVHMIGGGVAFGGMGIYLLIQTIMSYSFSKISDEDSVYKISKSTLYIRIVLTVLYHIFQTSTLIFVQKAIEQFTGDDILKFSKEDANYKVRVIAAVSEWLMLFTFCLYILTTTHEAKTIEYEGIYFRGKHETPEIKPKGN